MEDWVGVLDGLEIVCVVSRGSRGALRLGGVACCVSDPGWAALTGPTPAYGLGNRSAAGGGAGVTATAMAVE